MDNRKFIPVENVLNIYDTHRLWYSLMEYYNGYELSTDGYIRSMKHRKKYPFGIMITPKKNKDGTIKNPEDPIFELSNNNNERVQVHHSDLINIVKNQTHAISGYPRYTYIGDANPRNDRRFVKKQQNKQLNDNERKIPKFTIIKE